MFIPNSTEYFSLLFSLPKNWILLLLLQWILCVRRFSYISPVWAGESGLLESVTGSANVDRSNWGYKQS